MYIYIMMQKQTLQQIFERFEDCCFSTFNGQECIEIYEEDQQWVIDVLKAEFDVIYTICNDHDRHGNFISCIIVQIPLTKF